MDFDLTEEQRLLKESIDRFAADNARDPAAHSAASDLWPQLAELGVLAFKQGFADWSEGGADDGRDLAACSLAALEDLQAATATLR